MLPNEKQFAQYDKRKSGIRTICLNYTSNVIYTIYPNFLANIINWIVAKLVCLFIYQVSRLNYLTNHQDYFAYTLSVTICWENVLFLRETY